MRAAFVRITQPQTLFAQAVFLFCEIDRVCRFYARTECCHSLDYILSTILHEIYCRKFHSCVEFMHLQTEDTANFPVSSVLFSVTYVQEIQLFLHRVETYN
jgi:hypothetical protein